MQRQRYFQGYVLESYSDMLWLCLAESVKEQGTLPSWALMLATL